jgi:DNA-directed RNA polymerase subunit K/omega
MIQKPPIDKLVALAGNKYSLACGIAKRARNIIEQPHTATEFSKTYKPISAAAYELYEGKIKFINE